MRAVPFDIGTSYMNDGFVPKAEVSKTFKGRLLVFSFNFCFREKRKSEFIEYRAFSSLIVAFGRNAGKPPIETCPCSIA
jgi:hypothetical protein